MDTTLFIQVCKDEYGALFTVLRWVIELCPPELWDLSDDEPPFWQQAYHALWATDWFFGQNREKFPSPDFAEDERYDLAKRWETPLAKADILVYLDSIEAKGMALFDTLSAPALAAANPFSWTGPVVGNLKGPAGRCLQPTPGFQRRGQRQDAGAARCGHGGRPHWPG